MTDRSPSGSGGFKWRKWNRVIHRDAGYLAVALTIIYAISGIAVNHARDWNPNTRFVREEHSFAPMETTDRAVMIEQLVEVLELPGPPDDAYRASPAQIEMFYDGWSVQADVSAGTAIVERPKERLFLRSFNFLHLNDAGGLWTWVADLYALLLIILAVTGSILLKGKNGFMGRGKWLIGAGLAVPVVFLLFLRWL